MAHIHLWCAIFSRVFPFSLRIERSSLWNDACLGLSDQIGDRARKTYKTGGDVLFVLLGGIMVLAMHAGFAFLEVGTVRKKNQVNALIKIITDFSVSTIAYFSLATASLMASVFSPVQRCWPKKRL